MMFVMYVREGGRGYFEEVISHVTSFSKTAIMDKIFSLSQMAEAPKTSKDAAAWLVGNNHEMDF